MGVDQFRTAAIEMSRRNTRQATDDGMVEVTHGHRWWVHNVACAGLVQVEGQCRVVGAGTVRNGLVMSRRTQDTNSAAFRAARKKHYPISADAWAPAMPMRLRPRPARPGRLELRLRQ